jgi:predicted nucleic acid-binding protein
MVVVCDSSALINLALISQLHLLKEMFDGVLISPGVYHEVVHRGEGRVGSEAVRDASYICVVQLRSPGHVEAYIDPLSQTDAEVIVLAQERDADLVITRDRRLRRRARQEGLAAITTFALLVDAKEEGFIHEVKPLLDEMRRKGVPIRAGTYREVLRQAGELPSG